MGTGPKTFNCSTYRPKLRRDEPWERLTNWRISNGLEMEIKGSQHADVKQDRRDKMATMSIPSITGIISDNNLHLDELLRLPTGGATTRSKTEISLLCENQLRMIFMHLIDLSTC
jgi:hypothetical protein